METSHYLLEDFSEVHLCTHKDTKQVYILKVVLTSKMTDKKIADLLLGEIEIMLALNESPFSIGLLDYFVHKNNLCLIIDYCNGGDLDNYVRETIRSRKKPLNVEELRLIAWNVGCGLRDMHAKNIIHRDIKPKNILVVKDVDGKMIDIKLCDYGLSRKLEEQHGKASTILGTFDYFAPELFKIMEQMMNGDEQDKYDEAVDVWSYGVLLYFSLYGKTIMESPSSKNKVVKQHIISYYSLAGVPEGLVNLIKRCLEFDPKNRPRFQQLMQDPFFQTVDLVPRKSLAPYVQGKLIGEGINSKIYEGKNGKRTCVLKTLPCSSEDSKRVPAEINTMCNLRGADNIVKLHDYFIYNNLVYLVMENYPGGNLESFIWEKEKKHQIIPITQQIFIAYSVLNGINEIHKRQMIHRDIHPKNVLLKTDPSRNSVTEVAVSDFGFAKVLIEGNYANTKLGSYQSPELTLPEYQRKHDAKTDIWSYGMLVYFILFGIHAHDFMENKPMKMYREGEIKFNTKRPNLSLELINLMKSCLVPDSTKRPSAIELLKLDIFKPFCKQ